MSESEVEVLRNEIESLKAQIQAQLQTQRAPYLDLMGFVRASMDALGDQIVEFRTEIQRHRDEFRAAQERSEQRFDEHLQESNRQIARIDKLESDTHLVTERLTGIEAGIKDLPNVLRAYAFIGRQWENVVSNSLKGLIAIIGMALLAYAHQIYLIVSHHH